jgi:hypothetical protein
MATSSKATLLDLVRIVSEFATSDGEVVAAVVYLINSGKVRLCGTFAGARIDLGAQARMVPQSRTAPCEPV